jgi:hypothetical protein
LGERLLCKQEVVGSIPSGSTSLCAKALRLGKPDENVGNAKAVSPAPFRAKVDWPDRRG